MSLNHRDIEAVADLVMQLCGVCLDESKSYLIESRLQEILDRTSCASYDDLVSRARQPGERQLQQEVIDAITTQETLFFRDRSPFEAFRHKAVPELIDRKAGTPFAKRIRVWSAACSTGQEPYSIVMTLAELLPEFESWDVQVVATDISTNALATARQGRYAPHEVERGLSQLQLNRYFDRVEDK